MPVVALWNLAAYNEDSKVKVAGEGGIGAILRAMQTHGRHSRSFSSEGLRLVRVDPRSDLSRNKTAGRSLERVDRSPVVVVINIRCYIDTGRVQTNVVMK